MKGEAFSIALSLPDGWELKEQTPKRDAVLAQALLYCEGKEMAELSVEEYEPVSGVPPQEHYKVAYASLRLGSVAGWEDVYKRQALDQVNVSADQIEALVTASNQINEGIIALQKGAQQLQAISYAGYSGALQQAGIDVSGLAQANTCLLYTSRCNDRADRG